MFQTFIIAYISVYII